MLFNSPEFIFVFLPIVVAGFYLLRHVSFSAAFYWLIVLSLIFYGWNEPAFLAIIGTSILFNYAMGIIIDASLHPVRRLRFEGVFQHQLFNVSELYLLVLMFAVVWLLPNSAELLRKYRPVSPELLPSPSLSLPLVWRATTPWAVVTAVMFMIAVMNLGKVSEFIYFNF